MKSTRAVISRRLLFWHHSNVVVGGSISRHMHRLATFSSASLDESDSSTQSSCSYECHVHSSLSSGLIDYARGWAWQQLLLSRRLELRRRQQGVVDDADCVLLLQHTPVYTLGRGADESHLRCLQNTQKQRLARSNRGVGSARLVVDRGRLDLRTLPLHEAVDILSGINLLYHMSLMCAFIRLLCLFHSLTNTRAFTDTAMPAIAPNGVDIFRVERGGEVTFHGPGQLVVYPLLDLKRRSSLQQDLHWYLRMIEEIIILTLQEYHVDACRDEINTGVWVNEKKVAAVGVNASKWITTHGFALNVNPDLLGYFDTSNILPCGIEGRGVTSIHEILKEQGKDESDIPTLDEVAAVVLRNLQHVFDIEIQEGEPLW